MERIFGSWMDDETLPVSPCFARSMHVLIWRGFICYLLKRFMCMKVLCGPP